MYQVHESLYSILKKKKKKDPTELFQKVEQKKVSFVSYYDELIILIRVLQITGLFPISRDKNGRLISGIYSPSVFHCLLVFIAITCFSYVTIDDIVRIFLIIKIPFDEQILYACILFYTVVHFIPVFIFFERRKIVKYFENWNVFKVEFAEITGRPLIFNFKRRQKICLTVLVVCLSIFTYFVYRTVSARFRQFKMKKEWYYVFIITYTYYGILIFAVVFLWYFNTKAISEGAGALLKYFKECKDTGECSVVEMNQLWLRLQDLCCELGRAFSYTILFFMFYIFVIVMLIGYSAVAIFGKDTLTILGIIRLSLFFCGFLVMTFIPNLAHVATENVVDDILNFTLRWGALERNPLLARDLKWMVEYVAIRRPVISLAGYINLHRGVNLSMYAAMVTYFVVVFQFKISRKEEEHG